MNATKQKKPIIKKHLDGNSWAMTGQPFANLREDYSFIRDMDGSIDAPVAFPTGSTIKNVIVHRDGRRRPTHAIITSIHWRG